METTTKKLIVIGLDGESWSEIDRYRQLYLSDNLIISRIGRLLKRLGADYHSVYQRLRQEYNCAVLTCDAEIVHTVPAWLLAFSGTRLKQHGMACYRKPQKKTEFWSLSDFHYPLLWQTLENHGFDCKVIAFKLFSHTFGTSLTEADTQINRWLPTKFYEVVQNIRWAADYLPTQLHNPPDFFLYIAPFPDDAQHLRKARKITEKEYVNIRKEQDRLLESLLPMLTKHDFVIMSDHGSPFLLNGLVDWQGLRISSHNRDGMIITNLENPPTKLSQMYPFLLNYYGVDP